MTSRRAAVKQFFLTFNNCVIPSPLGSSNDFVHISLNGLGEGWICMQPSRYKNVATLWLPDFTSISGSGQAKRNKSRNCPGQKKTYMCLNIALSRVRNILECAFNVMFNRKLALHLRLIRLFQMVFEPFCETHNHFFEVKNLNKDNGKETTNA